MAAPRRLWSSVTALLVLVVFLQARSVWQRYVSVTPGTDVIAGSDVITDSDVITGSGVITGSTLSTAQVISADESVRNSTIVVTQQDLTNHTKTTNTTIRATIRIPLQNETFVQHKSLKGIVVYAKQRTGSSFANSMFFQQSNVFTVFEPLNNWGKDQVKAHGVPLLREVLQCDFIGKDHTEIKKRDTWFRNVVLCDNKPVLCKKKTIPQFQSTCKRHEYVAAKIIVLPQLSQLEVLMEEGVHVIHLVRDPRGVISSIKSGPTALGTNLKTNTEFIHKVKWYCDTLTQDLSYARLASEKGLPYILLRYEDLAIEPIKSVTNIYKSIGLEPGGGTIDWMKTLDGRNKHPNNYSDVREGAFGVVRNLPSKSAQKWREKLQYSDIVYIQDKCGGVMKQLGYMHVQSQAQLKDPSVDFLGDVPDSVILHA